MSAFHRLVPVVHAFEPPPEKEASGPASSPDVAVVRAYPIHDSIDLSSRGARSIEQDEQGKSKIHGSRKLVGDAFLHRQPDTLIQAESAQATSQSDIPTVVQSENFPQLIEDDPSSSLHAGPSRCSNGADGSLRVPIVHARMIPGDQDCSSFGVAINCAMPTSVWPNNQSASGGPAQAAAVPVWTPAPADIRTAWSGPDTRAAWPGGGPSTGIATARPPASAPQASPGWRGACDEQAGSAHKRPRVDGAGRPEDPSSARWPMDAADYAAAASSDPAGAGGAGDTLLEVRALRSVRAMEAALCEQYERYLTAMRCAPRCNATTAGPPRRAAAPGPSARDSPAPTPH